MQALRRREGYDESHEQKWKLFNVHPRAHMRVRVPANEVEKANAQLSAWRTAADHRSSRKQWVGALSGMRLLKN